MPSILSNYTSEPVSLVTSDDSPYEPPHRASIEKPAIANVKGRLMNGASVDGCGGNKRVEGIFFGESDGLNSSLQSLPNCTNGRSSDSTDSWDKAHSRNASYYSMTNGNAIVGESGRRSPGLSDSIPTSNAIHQVLEPKSKGTPTTDSKPPESSQAHGKGYCRGHSRVHSASAPTSHNIQPTYLNAMEALPVATEPASSLPNTIQLANRLSSPPVLPRANQPLAAASAMSLHPTAPHLHHRHTLEVPRVSTSRTSRDFSYPNTMSDANSENGRFSPSPRTPRASNTLGRDHTRSVHSDMLLDEIPQDGDMARWTETIRQKRASRRKKKEEEEDDRVVVGTKVDMNHVNWVTAYNMLTGIRFTVSRTNAKIDRELTDADFDARHKFSFDM